MDNLKENKHNYGHDDKPVIKSRRIHNAKELLDWFVDSYKIQCGFLKKYAMKCKKLIQKNQLCLLNGTVNAEYEKRYLRQDNYDFYRKTSDERCSRIILRVCLLV